MRPKKRNAQLQQARALRTLDSRAVAQRLNQRAFSAPGFQDEDPFVSKPDLTRTTVPPRVDLPSSDELHQDPERAEPRIHVNLISSDELHHDHRVYLRPPNQRQRTFAIFKDPVSSDELHQTAPVQLPSESPGEIRPVQSPPSTRRTPTGLVRTVTQPLSQYVPQYRYSPASTSRFSSEYTTSSLYVPDDSQVTPRTARRSEVRSQFSSQSSPQRRRRSPQAGEEDDAFGPGLEEFFADLDELDDIALTPRTDVIDYYSPVHAGTSLRGSDFFNVARQPGQDTIDYRHRLLAANRACEHCGAKHWVEERIKNSTQREPRFKCCEAGRVVIPPQGPYPPALQRLLAETETRRGKLQRTARTKKFQTLIRHYNNAFAFCSLGVDFDRNLAQATTGSYTFRVHGNVYHRIAPLTTTAHQPSFAQIWIFDTAEERISLRQRAFDNLEPAIVRLLETTLLASNPFVQSLQANRQRLRTEPNIQLELRIVERKENDPRTYNRPTASEVAALVPTSVSDAAKTRNVIIFPTRGHRTIHISDKSRVYLPLRYPLLCPFGETGWGDTYPSWDPRLGEAPMYTMEPAVRFIDEDDDLRPEDVLELDEDEDEAPRRGRNGSTRVTQQQWFRHYLQMREPLSALLQSGRLFHEVCVDAFASILTDRLTWVRNNQDAIRMVKANGLLDHAANDVSGADVGVPVILPPSFTGSPRQMHRSYLDAMALARQLGAPDFFITFTCNPMWEEIQRELTAGQSSCDRPDIVNRVFYLKLRQLLHELYAGGIFGAAATTCWTIEFQKRGLPHAHILLILQNQARCVTANDVDAAISAEIPDPQLEPLLFSVVTRFMLHGPCGPQAPQSGCMRDGKCRWGYPKSFYAETDVNNGRITYRRPDNGRTFTKGARMDKVYDNRNVAPYNAYLSKRLNAHVNVEMCHGFGSIKYLYKYVYKGPDFATGQLRRPVPPGQAQAQPQAQLQGANGARDEVQEFINSRYISANEAVWRIFEFPTHGRDVAVTILQIHLEGEQSVAVNTAVPLAMQTDLAERNTTLTSYFETNRLNPNLNVKYQDFPGQFVYNKKAREWRPRTRRPAVGRITWVNLSSGELYYLRLLLVNVAGQTSFADTRTYEGVLHPTYQAACLARGLLEDDGEWAAALEEAAHFQTGHALRALFVTIIINCAPSDTMSLWARFAPSLSDDCAHKLRTRFGYPEPTPEQCQDLALYYLQEQLAALNWTMERARLPPPIEAWAGVLETEGNRLLQEQRSYDIEALHEQLTRDTPRLNSDQRRAYETITQDAIQERNGLFFLDGPGGTGKTFVQNTCLAELRSRNLVALAVATTGIAATLLSGGTTAHSRFKIPVKDLDADSLCNIPKNSHLAELLRTTQLIFWDEAVMCHKHAFEAVSRTLQDLRDDDDPRKALPFGGITVCFCGDFRQILPVVKKGTRGQIVDATLKRTSFWRRVNVLRLIENMRLRREGIDDEERREIAAFADKLLSIGEATGSDEYVEWGLESRAIDNSVAALAADIYRDLQRRAPSADVLKTRAILAPYNEVVVDLNRTLLENMPGATSTFLSVDQCATDSTNVYPVEFLHAIEVPELPPHELRLKVGCPVLLLRNLDPPNGLCNGTRLRVHRLGRKVITCTILGSAHHGKQVDLPRIPMGCGGGIIEGLQFQRRHFPVRLAFAMTINKAQGQSFDRVGLLLQREVFSHGQLYVALSRVTSPNGVTMVLPDNDTARTGKVRNIVYPEALL